MRRLYLMLIPCYAGKKGAFDRVLNRSFYDGCKGAQRRRKKTSFFFFYVVCLTFVHGVYRMLQTTGQAKGDDESTGVRNLSFFIL